MACMRSYWPISTHLAQYPPILYLQCTTLYKFCILLLKSLEKKLKDINFILLRCVIKKKLDVQLNL